MKRKPTRNIPDFSRKRPGQPSTPAAEAGKSKPTVPQTPSVKPHATSSKSGRRGQ